MLVSVSAKDHIVSSIYKIFKAIRFSIKDMGEEKIEDYLACRAERYGNLELESDDDIIRTSV